MNKEHIDGILVGIVIMLWLVFLVLVGAFSMLAVPTNTKAADVLATLSWVMLIVACIATWMAYIVVD